MASMSALKIWRSKTYVKLKNDASLIKPHAKILMLASLHLIAVVLSQILGVQKTAGASVQDAPQGNSPGWAILPFGILNRFSLVTSDGDSGRRNLTSPVLFA